VSREGGEAKLLVLHFDFLYYPAIWLVLALITNSVSCCTDSIFLSCLRIELLLMDPQTFPLELITRGEVMKPFNIAQ